MWVVGNPTRITIPSYSDYARVTVATRTNIATNTSIYMRVYRDGAQYLQRQYVVNSSAVNGFNDSWSVIVPVTGISYLEFYVGFNAAATTVFGAETYMEVEIIEKS